MKKIAFILLFVLALSSAYTSSYDIPEFFVIANAASVRKNPSLKAPIVFVLPFGTEVAANKTDKEIIHEGEKYFWYELRNREGFVLGKYLATKRPEQIKKYRLGRRSTGYEFYYESELVLFNYKAYLIEYEDSYDPRLKIYKGRYIIFKDKIILFFEQGKEIKFITKKTDRIDKKRMELYWCGEADGYLEKDQFYYLYSPHYPLNKKECRFDDNLHIEGIAGKYSPGYFSTKIKMEYSSKEVKEFFSKIVEEFLEER